jgi:transcriptional regulator GlxA family with amidase domain
LRRLRGLLEHMLNEAQTRRPGYNAALKSGMTTVLVEILRDGETPASWREAFRAAPNQGRLALVFRFLENQYMEPVTVAQVARLCCMSRSHFHAVFKQEAGCTLIDYLNNLRIQAAQRMLAETDTPVLEVAGACGFQSLSHFYHLFKSRTGRTPVEHAKVARKPV